MVETHDVSASMVGGRSIEWGYNQGGSAVLERGYQVKQICYGIKATIKTCGCRGQFSSRRCSYFREGRSASDVNAVMFSVRIEQGQEQKQKTAPVRKID